MSEHNLEEDTAEPAQRARAYADRAWAYGEAAERLLHAGCGAVELPLLMLIATAAELSIKAMLRRGGASEEYLLLLGHDLVGAFEAAVRRGMYGGERPEEIRALAETLQEAHLMSLLRYPGVIPLRTPPADWALQALKLQLDAMGDYLSPSPVATR